MTLTCLPRAKAGTFHVLAVAPVTAVEPRYHWKASLVGVGLQVPGSAVSVDPTRTAPEIVGVGCAVNARPATADAPCADPRTSAAATIEAASRRVSLTIRALSSVRVSVCVALKTQNESLVTRRWQVSMGQRLRRPFRCSCPGLFMINPYIPASDLQDLDQTR